MSRVRHAARWIAIGLGGLILLLLLVLAWGWWWSGTQASLDWALRRFGEPGGLRVEGATGSLREGLQARRMHWEQEGLRATAQEVELAWQPLGLLGGRIQVDRMRAQAIEVIDQRPQQPGPGEPPQDLRLPYPVRIDQIALDRLRWQGPTTFEARRLEGNYRYAGGEHRLVVQRAESDFGSVTGELSVADAGEMPLSARLQASLNAPVPGREQPLPLRLQATAEGPLKNFLVQAQLRSDAATGEQAADVTARVTPWDESPVGQAQAQLQDLDLSLLLPQAPQTQLQGRLQARPGPDAAWELQADLANARPGPWDRQRLPFSKIAAQARWLPEGVVQVPRFEASVGGGTATGEAQWSQDGGWRVQAQVQRVDPSQIYSELGAGTLTGRMGVQVQGEDVELDMDLRDPEAPGPSSGVVPAASPRASARETWAPPHRFGQAGASREASTAPQPAQEQAQEQEQLDWQGLLQALRLRQLIGKARLSKGVLHLPDVDVVTDDARLQGNLQVHLRDRSAEGQLSLRAPGLTARFDGALAARSGGGTVDARFSDLAAATRWLRTVPAVPADSVPDLEGQGQLDLQWQGGWENPTLDAKLQVSDLLLPPQAEPGAAPLRIRDAVLTVDGKLQDARVRLDGLVQADEVQARVDLRGRVARTDAAWVLTLQGLQLAATGVGAAPGEWRVQLRQPPVTVRWQPDGVLLIGPGRATLTAPDPGRSQALVSWERSRWSPGELRTAGQVQGLPLEWVRLITGREPLGPRISGDLAFSGGWELLLSQDVLDIEAVLRHTGGDLVIQGEAGPLRTGIRQLLLTLENEGRQLELGVEFESERTGRLQGRVATRLVPGGPLGWQLPPNPPIQTSGQASGLSLSLLQLFAGPDWLGDRIIGDLALQARWDARIADTLELQAVVESTGGDLSVRPVDGNGEAPEPVHLGIRQLRLALENDGPQVSLDVLFESERAGDLRAQFGTRLVRGGPLGWQLPSTPPIRTSGRASGLSLSLLRLVAGPELLGQMLVGDLQFQAEWDATLAETLDLDAVVQHTGGDLILLAEAAGGETVRVPAGIRQARLVLDNEGQQVRVAVEFDSERAGQLEGWAGTRLVRGGALGWQLPPDAPLQGQLEAQLPRLRAWSVLAPPGWRVRGSMQADVQLNGTLSEPRFDGVILARDLAVRSVVEGVALEDGLLRARLEGQRIIIEELVFQGVGDDPGGGLRATGAAELGPDGFQLRLDASLDQLRASVRTDRQVTVSGQVGAVVGPSGVVITGKLRVDRALIVLPEEMPPELGDDVVVFNLPPGVELITGRQLQAEEDEALPLSMDVTIDLGNDVRVRGRGIDAGLRGVVEVSGSDLSDPQVNGVVRIVDGEFTAYGQQLEIERGILRFTGAATNPALDIVAVRPRLDPDVGVQVSGRAQSPDVRLYSAEPMPDSEKLSMLVLGRSGTTGGAEAALLQRAALALLAQRGTGDDRGVPGGIAGLLGLDELSVRRDEDTGAAFVIGRRIARNLYASYERSLSGALGTLYVFYDISQRLTLRAEAGERTAVDLIYRFSYD